MPITAIKFDELRVRMCFRCTVSATQELKKRSHHRLRRFRIQHWIDGCLDLFDCIELEVLLYRYLYNFRNFDCGVCKQRPGLATEMAHAVHSKFTYVLCKRMARVIYCTVVLQNYSGHWGRVAQAVPRKRDDPRQESKQNTSSPFRANTACCSVSDPASILTHC